MTKLKEFLDKRKQIKNLSIKDKKLTCPDCGSTLYKSGDSHIHLCMCYGQFYNKNIELVKSEKDLKLIFPSNFDINNYIQLLQSITKQR